MTKPKKRIIQGGIFAAGTILLVTGLLQDGFHDVMMKAIMICYECIGIG